MSGSRATLTIEGVTRPVRGATFGLHVKSEIWDPRISAAHYDPARAEVIYDLEVDVDERSGEDGAPAPHIQSMPVLRAAGGRHPDLSRLGTMVVGEVDDDCDEWDAWFGNDAPELCGNRVAFQGWEGAALRVRWEAHYAIRGRRLPFLFEGLVDFTGVHTTVREAADADVFVTRAWGGQPLETLERHVLGWTDHGLGAASDRRFSFSVVYSLKGEPLSDQYRVGPQTKEAATAELEQREARFEAAAASRAVGPEAQAPALNLDAGPPKRLFDGHERFSVEVPGDWTVAPEAEDPVMKRLGGLSLRRGAGPSQENLKALAVEMSIADDIVEYADTSLGAYASIWKVEERSALELSGARAERLVIEQKIGPVTTRLLKYFIAAPGESVIVMTFAAPPIAFTARVEGYEAIARSLVIAREEP